jgi:hypothetical protein
MIYTIAEHPLLSQMAQELTPEALAAQGDVAEVVLGLSDTAYSGAMAERAATAVVLQVNYQIVVTPEVLVNASETRGERAESHFQPAQLPDVYPPAAALVASLAEEAAGTDSEADQWESVVSVRSQGDYQ